ncbi:hypothetical protein yinte0001_6300 [Yersinia intermedia ATCC 29909]|nr:hypothetical protein yinte0001_6300 [Yersinia intermedia ATCC 29909]
MALTLFCLVKKNHIHLLINFAASVYSGCVTHGLFSTGSGMFYRVIAMTNKLTITLQAGNTVSFVYYCLF